MNQPGQPTSFCYEFFDTYTCPSRGRVRKTVCDCFCNDAEYGPKIADLQTCMDCPRLQSPETFSLSAAYAAKTSGPTTPNPSEPLNLPPGVGTSLHNLFAEYGVQVCPTCLSLIYQMNDMGPVGCEQNIEAIIDNIFPRAKEWINAKLPITSKLFGGLGVTDLVIRLKIKSLINKAIEQNQPK